MVSVTAWSSSRHVPRRAELVLGAELERAGRADRDAVAAVDAGRLGERRVELGRDPGVEAAPGDVDRERVLVLLAAGVDALVTEDAFRVVADVELVVDLDRLRDGCGRPAVGDDVMACAGAIALVAWRRGRPEALRLGAVRARGSRARRAWSRGRPTRRGAPSRACRESRTRSESVCTFIPASALREHAGTSTREPSSSTTQTRQTFAGSSVSP